MCFVLFRATGRTSNQDNPPLGHHMELYLATPLNLLATILVNPLLMYYTQYICIIMYMYHHDACTHTHTHTHTYVLSCQLTFLCFRICPVSTAAASSGSQCPPVPVRAKSSTTAANGSESNATSHKPRSIWNRFQSSNTALWPHPSAALSTQFISTATADESEYEPTAICWPD